MEHDEFFRVADRTYYIAGDEIAPYNFKVFINEYGKEKWLQLQKFQGFICSPDNLHYSRFCDGFVNTYRPVIWKTKPGKWEHIKIFLRHIFSDQYEMGLDYIKSLYCSPQRPIQILLLVSRERCTGKSTFLYFLQDIFGKNVIVVDNNTMHSNFNGVWADKLIIGIEETLLNRKGDTEFLRKHSTGREIVVNKKGQDQYTIDFFGKFILCSNDMDCPLPIDFAEDRFWVVEVGPIKREDPELRRKMRGEIPAFLNYLVEREYSEPLTHRLLFSRDRIQNKALFRIQRNSVDPAEREIASFLLDLMDMVGADEIRCSANGVDTWIKSGNLQCEKIDFRRVMKNWGVHMSGATNFIDYKWEEGEIIGTRMQNTRCYFFTRHQIISIKDISNLRKKM